MTKTRLALISVLIIAGVADVVLFGKIFYHNYKKSQQAAINAAKEKEPKTAKEVYKEADYLARLEIKYHNGKHGYPDTFGNMAGLLINFNKRYLILTAAHLLDDDYEIKEIRVYLKSRLESFVMVVDKFDKELDVLTLKFADPEFTYSGRLASINLFRDFEIGDKVYALGSPLSTDYTLSEGIVGNMNFGHYRVPVIHWGSVFIHSAPIAPGSSGGPLLNECGLVIGMNVGHHPDYNGFSLAIYMEDILNWLGSHY